MSLTDWLVSYYKMDTGSWTTLFDSVGTNDWSINWATWTTGKINDWLSFNGSSSNINLWQPTALTNIFAWWWTYSCWVKINTIWEVTRRFFDKGYKILFLLLNDWVNRAQFTTFTSTNPWFRRFTEIPLNEWIFVSVTWNSNTPTIAPKVYYNWVSQSISSQASQFLWTVNDAWFDFIVWNNSAGNRAFDWKTDEVWIWNRVLTSAEITELYNNWDGLQYWQPWFWWDVTKRTNIFFKNN